MAEGRRLTEHYRLESLARTGEGGLFFCAVDLRTGQPVAVEMIRQAAPVLGAQERERFLATAAVLASLEHPSLPRVLDYGFTATGNAFLVTEPVSGANLAACAGLSPARILGILVGVLDGLETLSRQGIELPRLRTDGIVVTADSQGESVKLVELGEAGLASPPDQPPAAPLRRDLALLACGLLGAQVDAAGEVEIPETTAARLDDVAALERLLASWLRPANGGADPPFAELRRRLQFQLGGGLATLPAATVAVLPEPSSEQPAVQPPPPSPPETPRAPRGGKLRPWAAVGLLAVAGGVGVVGVLFVLTRADKPPAVVSPEVTVSPSPTPSPLPVTPTPAPTPSPSPDPEEEQREAEALAAAEARRLAGALERGLATASLPALREAVKLSAAVPSSRLSTSARRNLARAKDALAADSRLSKAERDGQPRPILEAAADLLVLLPASARGLQLRDRAASDLEAAADQALAAGRLDEAESLLAALRQVLPQRSGLDERRARLDREKRSDQALGSALAEATRLGEQKRPHEGLARLAEVTPAARYRDRFSRLEEKLETQLAELDRGSPRIAVREGFEETYEKDATVKVPLRITDDYGIRSVEAWAVLDKGQRKPVPVVHGAGDAYEATLAAGVHENQDLALYVAATDHSGHRTQHGPTSLKRKRWYRP